MRISPKRQAHLAVLLLTFASAPSALAQKVTEVPELTGRQVLRLMANPATGGVAGDVLAVATATESPRHRSAPRPEDSSSSWIRPRAFSSAPRPRLDHPSARAR